MRRIRSREREEEEEVERHGGIEKMFGWKKWGWG